MTAILLIFGSCQYKIYIFSTKESLRDIIARFFSAAPPAAANTQHKHHMRNIYPQTIPCNKLIKQS